MICDLTQWSLKNSGPRCNSIAWYSRGIHLIWFNFVHVRKWCHLDFDVSKRKLLCTVLCHCQSCCLQVWFQVRTDYCMLRSERMYLYHWTLLVQDWTVDLHSSNIWLHSLCEIKILGTFSKIWRNKFLFATQLHYMLVVQTASRCILLVKYLRNEFL